METKEISYTTYSFYIDPIHNDNIFHGKAALTRTICLYFQEYKKKIKWGSNSLKLTEIEII